MNQRMSREIDQILHDSDENDQIRPNPDHLTPEETAAKADAMRAAWADAALHANTHDLSTDEAATTSLSATFTPPPPAPYVPRNRVDPVRVLCYAACALLLGVVWVNVVRWAL